ncbi:MAG: sulfite exporter TauE/SafE family protein [Armatimonadota bacterium]
MDAPFLLAIGVVSVAAGLLGAMLGLGGGIILVPALVLLLGVPEKTAVATSLLGVIATSVTASTSHLRYRYTNVPLAMQLESGTVFGALIGSVIFRLVSPRWIALLFALLQGYVAWTLSRRREEAGHDKPAAVDMNGVTTGYVDQATGETVHYISHRIGVGWVASLLAGVLSALLGVGGGLIKVPVMTLLMGVPLKAAAATSSFMIGITGSVSAAIYLLYGYVNPMIAAPSVLGVMAGAYIGAGLSRRLRSRVLRNVLILLLMISAVRMIWKVL